MVYRFKTTAFPFAAATNPDVNVVTIESVDAIDAIAAAAAAGLGDGAALTEAGGTGDQLTALLSAITSAGTGARTVAITVNDGTSALESARVRVTKGALSYTQETSAAGLATFNLDDGAWVVAITLAGYTYSGTTLVVDGNETVTYSMTAASFTPSTQPGAVTVRWTVIDDADYLPCGAGEGTIQIRIKTPPTDDGYAWSKGIRTATSDANGVVEFAEVPKGCTLLVKLGASTTAGEWTEVEIPASATSPHDGGEVLGAVP